MEYRPSESSNASCILQGEFYTCPEGRGMKYPNHKTGRHTTTFIKASCTIVMVSWRLHAASRWGIPTDTRWIPGGGMAHSGTATSRFCQWKVNLDFEALYMIYRTRYSGLSGFWGLESGVRALKPPVSCLRSKENTVRSRFPRLFRLRFGTKNWSMSQ
jgi:hypothetical protein